MLSGSVGFVMIQVVRCITPNCVAMTLHSFRIPHSPFQGTLCNSNLTKMSISREICFRRVTGTELGGSLLSGEPRISQ